MIELYSHGLLARDEDIINLIIFGIIMAFGMIANMVKARSEKSQKSRQQKSDTSQEEQITSSQDQRRAPSRLEQILGSIAKPADDSETSKDEAKSQQRKRSYTPGGFAEVLRQDRAIEETLTSSHPKAEKQKFDEGLQRPFKSFHKLDEMEDFHDMGSLDTTTELTADTSELTRDIFTVSLDRLPDAILYSEILAKPIALRDNDNTF